MISVHNLHKSFGKLKVLDDVNVTLEAGQVVALIGPNGSGKTTFIRSILGMVKPEQGSILYNGQEILKAWKYRENIGYMPQLAKFPERIQVKELLDMMKDIRKNNKVDNIDEELIELFDLKKIYQKRTGTLSGGTKQKVSAALTFLFNPNVLILDEPTTGLDPVSAEILKNKITKEQSKQKLVLITSHILSDIEEVASHVMYLHEGKMQFVKSIEQLKMETQEVSLNKAIVKIMQQEIK
ncbi:MAG: ABC transporter ATP-binding protein [Bacteroidetes bacterium]|nr:ABC transporter ATP-binding protein [Bacteroidota bacterium]